SNLLFRGTEPRVTLGRRAVWPPGLPAFHPPPRRAGPFPVARPEYQPMTRGARPSGRSVDRPRRAQSRPARAPAGGPLRCHTWQLAAAVKASQRETCQEFEWPRPTAALCYTFAFAPLRRRGTRPGTEIDSPLPADAEQVLLAADV